MYRIRNIVFILLIILCNYSYAEAYPAMNDSAKVKVFCSSEQLNFPATNVVDGVVSQNSKWLPQKTAFAPHSLIFDLNRYHRISGIIIHSGIPENEQTENEKLQANGFWAVKHFKVQYWDEANWTDIPGAEITENRLSVHEHHFGREVIASKLRLVIMDDYPSSLMEVEFHGTVAKDMPEPTSSVDYQTDYGNTVPKGSVVDAYIEVNPNVVGQSFKYVAYNQAHYLPGSNVSSWLKYSNVNSLRLWTSLSHYAPEEAMHKDETIQSLSDFEANKRLLRARPESSQFIHWDELHAIFTAQPMELTNKMQLNYVLEECLRLGISPLFQMNWRRFSDNWADIWVLWQRYYALAYYGAKVGDVQMFAIQNEPNHRHSGPVSIEDWLLGMRIANDAVRSALQDVNEKYNKNLVPKLVGPVTAGTNFDWWEEVIKNIRVDYKGDTINYDLIDIFSTHSYNSPAAGYEKRVESIRALIRENHPEGKEIPVVFTEIGRWMNAYLIDKEETMDSPSLYTEWAGIYENNMMNGCYGMWAFKFGSNTSPTYPRGIKSGHHYIWNGKRHHEETWNNVALGALVGSESVQDKKSLQSMVDGDVSDASSCHLLSSSDSEKYIYLSLKKAESVGSAMIYCGSSYGVYTGPDRIREFALQYKHRDVWIDIEGATEKNNKYVQVLLPFKSEVQAKDFRLLVLGKSNVSIREIKLFAANEGYENSEESYDVSGIHAAGEVVRLFAKGFKDQRDLFETKVSEKYPGLQVSTSFDTVSGNYYMYLVQRADFNYAFTVDLSALANLSGFLVSGELVSSEYSGQLASFQSVSPSGTFNIELPAQSVMLLTIPTHQRQKKELLAKKSYVLSGEGALQVSPPKLKVSLDNEVPENHEVSFLQFKNEKGNHAKNCLLAVNGYTDQGQVPMPVHVYAFSSERKLKAKQLKSWASGSNAFAKKIGEDVHVVGQINFTQQQGFHYLDLTTIKGDLKKNIYLVLARESRYMGDYGDKGRSVIIGSESEKNKSKLFIY